MGKVHDVIESLHYILFKDTHYISTLYNYTHRHTGTQALTHAHTAHTAIYIRSSLVQECNIGSTKLVYIACALTS